MEVFIHLNTARGAEKEFRKSLEQIRSVYGDVDNTLTYTARRNRGPFRHGR